MSKRKTVRINMEMLDGYLKAKNIHPKEFCETQLGFTDGWYYTIRKNGGRGVKVLSAQLIARITGIDYKTLVIDEKNVVKKETINAKIDAVREVDGNPSVTIGDSSLCTRESKTAGASPRPTEKKKERETGNPSPTEEIGVMKIRYSDLLPIMFFDLHGENLNADFAKGYLCALNSIFKHDDIRKETEKNARPEED